MRRHDAHFPDQKEFRGVQGCRMVEHDMQLVTDLTNRIVVSWRRFGFRSTSSIDIVDTAERRAAENHAAVRWFCEKHRRVR